MNPYPYYTPDTPTHFFYEYYDPFDKLVTMALPCTVGELGAIWEVVNGPPTFTPEVFYQMGGRVVPNRER